MIAPDGKNYTLGRGKLYFDQFAPGTQNTTGQRYFGNTPEFNATADSEELEHFDSDNGVNVKDDSVTLSNTRTGSFTTDNINLDNVALFYLGEKSTTVQTSLTAQTQTIKVKQGRFYQIGASDSNPAGYRHLDNFSAKIGSTAVTAAGNYEVDLPLGRLYIEPGSTDIVDDAELVLTFDVKAYSQNMVISSSDEIVGALYFESTNPKGELLDYYWPYVKLSPNGDFNLKSGDDWQSIPFNIEFLKKGNLEAVYITDRGTTS
ncbi:hypothetical protein SAMN05216577_12838 [Pseudomonas citronellolis]|uniref:Uncharacterized protein n=1 Tax=Pseudomonas citronellolis TaxID=53408 RepID=A0AAQ1QYT6_9PSED|nr:hypothetical protein [Pseudomonas citronellolis]SFD52472.1 hypothetical protein SAMN05216577_12838 [Pseudomonas citronellolis]